jgi:hypothetical protein
MFVKSDVYMDINLSLNNSGLAAVLLFLLLYFS